MDKESAKKLIRNTFQNSFDKDKFIYFIKNLLNQYDESKAFHLHGCYIPDSFKDYIKSYERIGTYTDSEEKKIDILIVHLKRETTIDRARTAQRNFIARYLKERGEKDAGLIAFVSPEEEDWRFSFVKMEYKFEKTPKGDVKVKEEFTPARRYSFLVGKNESSHTAQSCFVDILINDFYNLKLSEVEEAFNIEKVTKEFYEKYRNLFLQVKDTLDGVVKEDEEIRQEFQGKGVNVVDFSKKLLGQIVFLYFLQKKGWFGVKKGQKWGSGSKHFLRELFEKKHCDYKNFFNDILEPLFYEALRNDRSYEDHYFSYFKCKIPFLNGGLFDPLNDYDWAKTDILLPNTLFSNQIKTKEGDMGTGILDFFDRYNFTVKEDEPLEKEVAVDPEMLGKVFENLLEVKDRKSKGTYYTPREIVHYMCQQSLINYLYTEVNSKHESRTKEEKIQIKLLGKPDPIQQSLIIEKDSNIISKEDIEKLIKYGDTTIENDNHVATKGEETKTYSFKLPENIRKNAEFIDEALKNIRVCDPAIGSGAFPVGMMNEIIRARNALTPYLSLQEEETTKQSRTIYNFKRHAIQSCLYGVDIDPGAVEIAKLRLWLSLIVDEEDINKIKPLPNLDYKIVCGNSLLGIERNLENWKLFAKLEELKPLFFNETNANKKQEYKIQIDGIISKITNGHKDFNFEVYFSEVFHDKNGFDVVIANPPYVEHKKLKGISNRVKEIYTTYSGRADLYVYFYEKGIRILRENGTLFYITSNKFIKTSYGENLREYFTNFQIIEIIDFTEVHVFDALVASCIFCISKRKDKNNKIKIVFADDSLLNFTDLNVFIDKNEFNLDQNNLSKNIWQLESSNKLELKAKIETSSKKLCKVDGIKIFRGITTGYNTAFIISELEKEQLCKADSNNEKIIKPILRGRDMGKYYCRWAGLWMILTKYGSYKDIEEKYTTIFSHLKKYEMQLKNRGQCRYSRAGKAEGQHHWLELDNNPKDNYLFEFEKEKIIWGLTADKWAFAYDDKKHYLPSNGYILTSSTLLIKYILALLNSKLMRYYFGFIGIMTAGGAFTLKHQTISEFPIKEISIIKQEPFISLVDKILAITKADGYLVNFEKQARVHEYERQIDQMVYKLYGLTEEEIKIVEKNK